MIIASPSDTFSLMRTVTVLALTTLLSACSKPLPPAPVQPAVAATPAQAPAQAGPAPAPKPTADDKILALLMKAVYGEGYREATRDALVELPDPDDAAKKANFVIRPVAHTVLPSGETVLVANAEMAGDDGVAMTSHASGGFLNVFLMRQAGGNWEILKRHENVTSLGSHGSLGTVQWVQLAKDKPGLAVLSGGTWQGYTIENLSLFDLTADSMRDLAAQIQVHSDSEGGCDPEGDSKCWSITGKWRFEPPQAGAQYDDLHVDFSGESSTRVKAAKAQRLAKKVSGAARYAYDGKVYKLVDGTNPVPGI